MSRIGIVGYGIVGKAVAYGFRNEKEIRYYDKYKHSDPLDRVVEESDFVFVCLPTPFAGDHIDLSIVDENVAEIAKHASGKDKIVVIKSTVLPGTTRNYAKKYADVRFCFNPEFLTEANYLEDFVKADRIVIGADDDKVSLAITDLYRDTFPKTLICRTDLTTAEMVKYMANSFFATKVTFANEMYDLCEKLQLKYEEVKEMVIADRRIANTHLDVTTVRGFGGKCFPKDIVAMIGLYKDLGVDASLLESVWRKNLMIRKIRDWEGIPFSMTREDKSTSIDDD